jgi:RNA polymerase sigma-70 factor (ECF subfamily)
MAPRLLLSFSTVPLAPGLVPVLARAGAGAGGVVTTRAELRDATFPVACADLDDAALARAVNDPAQRPAAARELVRRYAPMVRRILKRSIGVGADVQDVLQEVFLRVFNKIGGLRDPQALKQFVISITVNVLRWELKRRQIRRLVGLSSEPEELAEGTAAADFVAREALRRFDRVLRTLSANERTAFVLRFMEGLTLPEAAEAAGVSLATVKRHLDRAWAHVAAAVAADPALSGYLSRAHRPDGSAEDL